MQRDFTQKFIWKGLIKMLSKLGYEATCQSGSHIRLTTNKSGTHHLKPLKPGTLSAIMKDIPDHFNKEKEEIWEFISKK